MASRGWNSLVTLDVDVEAELAAKYSVSLRSFLLVWNTTSRAGYWGRDRSYRSVGRYKLLINILSLSLSILHYPILILCHIGSFTPPPFMGNTREQIRSLPTVMAFKDGQPISQFSESHAPSSALDIPFLSRWVPYVVTQLDASTLTMLGDPCQMVKPSSLQWVRSQRNRSRCSSIASRKSKNGRYHAL